jgi:hypothetical protein
MCQMELALLVVSAKRRERGDGALKYVDRRHLDRGARIAADRCALIHPLGSPGRLSMPACDGPREELEALLAQLVRRGVEAALIA